MDTIQIQVVLASRSLILSHDPDAQMVGKDILLAKVSPTTTCCPQALVGKGGQNLEISPLDGTSGRILLYSFRSLKVWLRF